MPELQLAAGLIAGILELAGYGVYVFSTLGLKAKPNRASWIIWSVLGILIAASYYAVGARETWWLPLGTAIGATVMALLSLKYGMGGWSVFDRLCLLGAFAGLLAWWLFNSPFTALAMGMFVDAVGFLPTIKKSWENPSSESRATWALFFAGAVFNVLAVTAWTVEIAAYPVYIFLLDAVVLALLFRGGGMKRNRPGRHQNRPAKLTFLFCPHKIASWRYSQSSA